MKKMNVRTQRALVITALLTISLVLIGAIYMANNRQNPTSDLQATETASKVNVEAIDNQVENVEASVIEEENQIVVEVQEIDASESILNSDPKVQEETIEEPMPVEPEKPVSTPPEHTPQTTDDLENTDKVPEYSEEEVTFTPEEPVVEDKPVETETKEESNLVPDSQNPFLQPNIPSNGNNGLTDLEDVTDYVPGTGDKF